MSLKSKQDNDTIIKQHIVHPFEPIINTRSRVLILGSLPSVKSREDGFYYGHKQNRFWKVLSSVLGCELPHSTDEKQRLLEDNNVALYDSIYECDICGSSDSSIENVVPSDIAKLIEGTDIGMIYCNGSTSYKYYIKYHADINIPVVCLPSTSPANAGWKEESLVRAWERVGRYLKRTQGVNYNVNSNRYYSLNDYCRAWYGMKLYKLALDGGFSCPNRDGSKGVGGCIFCDNEGSGHFTGSKLAGPNVLEKDILSQLSAEKLLVSSKLPKNSPYGYIAYFQAYTGTYAAIDKLRKLYYEVLKDPEVRVLSIATRPDCLGSEVLALLKELSEKIDIWVELGLQTTKAESVKLINRCYDNKVYDKAVIELRKAGVKHIVTHVILGLPGENREDMLTTVRHIVNSGVDGIKLQLLHVLKGTVLADMYLRGEFECLALEEYAKILKETLEIIPPDMVVHRLTGDGDKSKLIAPLWSADKKNVLNYINSHII